MKLYKLLTRTAVCVFALLGAVACTNDFGGAGAGLVDQVNFDTGLTAEIDITSYSVRFDAVQTNNLPVGAIGVYNDPVYGTATVSALSQVTLSRFDPSFGDNPELTGVYLTLPYFSSREETDEDGNTTYTLDSIFSNTGPMKLSIYRSNYFLNDLDPDDNFESAAVYFSDEFRDFDGIEGDLLYEDEAFIPSNLEIRLDSIGNPLEESSEIEIASRLAPSLRVKLDNDYFTQNLINQENSENLLNQNNFRDYFRGIYIKAEAVNGNGSYILFNYDGANITAFYQFSGTDDSGDDEVETTENSSIALNFGGVQVLGIDGEFNPAIQNDINNADVLDGEDNLYLKGGNGSIAVINLFPDRDEDGIEDQLDILKSCNVIINEANLIFFVDQDQLGAGTGVLEPERIFIYDYDNNRTLIDGQIDLSAGNDGAVSSRTNHLGRLTREIEGDRTSPGESYRIRITRHLNNIVVNDSANVNLALTVSQNVLNASSSRVRGENGEILDRRIPSTNIISQEGTILHGNRSVDEDKRLKLRINYTLTEEINPDTPCGRILGL
ncbi:DUF4270 domain-containing protein [Dokdonia sinensis]|uniref:DUF4270 domain-containing protein n=1 Tax=Dokdonia sinensis TaxID=2479847 RepID=A0A3M0GGE8_9FLAO|nr:DUF4270 domain-containing protein [Dokdonia sinensis]RMB56396.1 DUF4270 domain-containing protein [Dokdonia sinensis]